MYLAVGKVEATCEYGNSFHSFSHGCIKKLSKYKEKTQVWCMLQGQAWLLGRYAAPQTKLSIFFHHLVQEKD